MNSQLLIVTVLTLVVLQIALVRLATASLRSDVVVAEFGSEPFLLVARLWPLKVSFYEHTSSLEPLACLMQSPSASSLQACSPRA